MPFKIMQNNKLPAAEVLENQIHVVVLHLLEELVSDASNQTCSHLNVGSFLPSQPRGEVLYKKSSSDILENNNSPQENVETPVDRSDSTDTLRIMESILCDIVDMVIINACVCTEMAQRAEENEKNSTNIDEQAICEEHHFSQDQIFTKNGVVTGVNAYKKKEDLNDSFSILSDDYLEQDSKMEYDLTVPDVIDLKDEEQISKGYKMEQIAVVPNNEIVHFNASELWLNFITNKPRKNISDDQMSFNISTISMDKEDLNKIVPMSLIPNISPPKFAASSQTLLHDVEKDSQSITEQNSVLEECVEILNSSIESIRELNKDDIKDVSEISSNRNIPKSVTLNKAGMGNICEQDKDQSQILFSGKGHILDLSYQNEITDCVDKSSKNELNLATESTFPKKRDEQSVPEHHIPLKLSEQNIIEDSISYAIAPSLNEDISIGTNDIECLNTDNTHKDPQPLNDNDKNENSMLRSENPIVINTRSGQLVSSLSLSQCNGSKKVTWVPWRWEDDGKSLELQGEFDRKFDVVRLTQEPLCSSNEEENLCLTENEVVINPPSIGISCEFEMDIGEETHSDSCKGKTNEGVKPKVNSPKDVFLCNQKSTVDEINKEYGITEKDAEEIDSNVTYYPKKSFTQAFESIIEDSTPHSDHKMDILDQEVPTTKLCRTEDRIVYGDNVPNQSYTKQGNRSDALGYTNDCVSNERLAVELNCREDEQSIYRLDKLYKIKPLKTCNRPRRVGLSRRVHPY